MENRELDEFRGILIDKQNELRDVIARHNEQLEQQLSSGGLGEAHVDFNHPADMVGGDPDYGKELNLLRRERLELTAVLEALDRIADGSYGTCEWCKEAIPYRRLKAIPYAKRCVDCQELLDRKTPAGF